MSELTKQYFDKQLGKLATKEELKKLATKQDIIGLETRLEAKIETEVAELAGMVSRRFDKIENELDVRDKVNNLDHRMSKIEQALNIKN